MAVRELGNAAGNPLARQRQVAVAAASAARFAVDTGAYATLELVGPMTQFASASAGGLSSIYVGGYESELGGSIRWWKNSVSSERSFSYSSTGISLRNSVNASPARDSVGFPVGNKLIFVSDQYNVKQVSYSGPNTTQGSFLTLSTSGTFANTAESYTGLGFCYNACGPGATSFGDPEPMPDGNMLFLGVCSASGQVRLAAIVVTPDGAVVEVNSLVTLADAYVYASVFAYPGKYVLVVGAYTGTPAITWRAYNTSLDTRSTGSVQYTSPTISYGGYFLYQVIAVPSPLNVALYTSRSSPVGANIVGFSVQSDGTIVTGGTEDNNSISHYYKSTFDVYPAGNFAARYCSRYKAFSSLVTSGGDGILSWRKRAGISAPRNAHSLIKARSITPSFSNDGQGLCMTPLASLTSRGDSGAINSPPYELVALNYVGNGHHVGVFQSSDGAGSSSGYMQLYREV